MDEDDSERLEIREKISNMSFEELAKLKQELGGQAYNEAIFGVRKKPCIQKRLNKNRPTEMSSKIRPEVIARTVGQSRSSSKPVFRDPRFDHLCGEYEPKSFKEHYSFLKDIKSREKEELKNLLQTEVSDPKKEKIKFLIKRMENQESADKRMEEVERKKREEYEERIQMLREGKKPHYVKKSEKRVLDLVERYETLKKKGKVKKEIEKLRQKAKNKDRRKFSTT